MLALLAILVVTPCGLNAISFTIPFKVLKPNNSPSSRRHDEVKKLLTRVDMLEKLLNQSDQDAQTSGQKLSTHIMRLDTNITSLSKMSESRNLAITDILRRIDDLQRETKTESLKGKQFETAIASRLTKVETQMEDMNCPKDKYYKLVTSSKLCLKIIEVRLDFDKSRTLCEQEKGGRLLKLDTMEKIQAFNAYFKRFHRMGNAFLGMVREPRRRGAPFHWTDGSDIKDSYWNPGEPNSNNNMDDCAAIDGSSGYKWSDIYCSDKFSYVICEIAK